MTNWRIQAQKHAEDYFPSEVCGLIVVIKGRKKYIRCKNIAANTYDHFIIDPIDYANAEDKGTIFGIFHSHPYQTPFPSSADLTACENSKKVWYIYAVALGQWHEFEPTGYKAPLIGRHYAFGVHDCWTLVKDYYESVGIKLRDWDRPNNPDNFRINPYFDKCFKDTGFRELRPDEELEHGDSLLFSINSNGLNHVGVFLLPQQMILHHIEGRLSSKDFYGEWLVKCTGKRLRYVK